MSQELSNEVCVYCGKSLTKKRALTSEFCTKKCENQFGYDAKNFNGDRRTAIGYNVRKCWICGRMNLPKINVHHVYGRKTLLYADPEPNVVYRDVDLFVVLCPGCHHLVYVLSRRVFLEDANKLADLITLARCERLMPNAKTTVRIVEV